MAISRQVSLVERSPSTVTALKVSATATDSMSCSAAGGRAASVATKASMVAMFGAIMPEPLAIPAIRTGVRSIWVWATAPLGNVSVVMIADAAAAQLSASRPATSSGTTGSIRPASSTTPITPVEASITWSAGTPRAAPAASAVRRAASAPGAPVKLLAQPALQTRARTRPPSASSAARHQSTGAEPTPCLVNTPAAVAPGSKAMSRRSGRSCR